MAWVGKNQCVPEGVWSQAIGPAIGYDRNGGEVIQKSVQLAAGRTAQEYHQRKGRKGGYREDCYHAPAVQTDRHLIHWIVYILPRIRGVHMNRDELLVQIKQVVREVEWESGVVISSIVRNCEEWNSGIYQAMPFHQRVQREGIRL
jgi:hypothetical protein